MSLSPPEIQKIRNYLGYGNITKLALPYIDTATVFETVVQENTDGEGERLIREQWLPQIATVEKDIFDARKRYKVSAIPGDVILNRKEHRELLALRDWLIDRLAETVRVERARMRKGSHLVLY